MLITRVKASNWRNFQSVDIPLKEFTYLLGSSGSGKSALLDIFRFLGDICRDGAGGLQGALGIRGGLSQVRSLLNSSEGSKKSTIMHIDVELSEKINGPVLWRYFLALRMEGQGKHRDLVLQERVWHKGRLVLSRPNAEDRRDVQLLTQTYLEQSAVNTAFREITEFFASGNCLLPGPGFSGFYGGTDQARPGTRILGSGLMDRIMQVQDSARNFRMMTIGRMLKLVVPEFSELAFWKDEYGKPHLEVRYRHHRQKNLQTDEWFTDDMLRMIDFFWSSLDDLPFLMLERPEKYLPDNLVRRFPAFLVELRRLKKDKTYRMMPQIVLTSNSEILMESRGIDPDSIILLESAKTGAIVRTLDVVEKEAINMGASLADVLVPVTQVQIAEKIRFYK